MSGRETKRSTCTERSANGKERSGGNARMDDGWFCESRVQRTNGEWGRDGNCVHSTRLKGLCIASKRRRNAKAGLTA